MARVVEYTLEAKEDIAFFKKSRQAHILKKIRQLIESIQQSPFGDIGKPEALKYELAVCWLRRINKEHRLVYEVSKKHQPHLGKTKSAPNFVEQ